MVRSKFIRISKHIGIPIILIMIGYLINPFKLGFLFGYPLILVILSKQSFIKKNLDLDFLLLLVLSAVYALFYAFDPVQGTQSIIVYFIFPALFYLLGKYIWSRLGNTHALFVLLMIVGVVYSLSGLISVMINIMENGFGQIDRSIPMFWSPSADGVAATIMGSFFVFNMCIPALLVYVPKKLNLLFRIAMISIFILSILCVLRIGTRTQIAIFVITTLVSLIYIIPRQSLRRNTIMFIVFVGGVFFLIQNLSIDLNSDLLSAFADRMEGSNSNLASGGGRTQRWTKSLEYIFVKPLGWKVEEFGHSHNLWLDVLRVSGIIPFFLLIIFSVRSYINIKRATKIDKKEIYFNNQIRIYALGLFLLFMVEPIFEGMFSLFVVFCFLMGIVNKYRTERLKFT